MDWGWNRVGIVSTIGWDINCGTAAMIGRYFGSIDKFTEGEGLGGNGEDVNVLPGQHRQRIK